MKTIRGLVSVATLLLLQAVAPAAVLRTSQLAFEVDEHSGAWSLTDRRTGVGWGSSPAQARFGEATLAVAGKRRSVALTPTAVTADRREVRLEFQPVAENPAARLRARVSLGSSGDSLEFAYEADASLVVEGVRLLDDALGVADTDGGYVVVPVREGLLIPADSGLSFTHRFDTYAYEGCHMRMTGFVKRGSAALVTWEDPYIAVEVRSVVTNGAAVEHQRLSTSVVLRKSARSVRVQVLGAGGYVELARRYREVAQREALVVTWDQKIRENPVRERYLGATNFKLWSALDRRVNEDGSRELSVRTNWTFDEAGQVAAHLKDDLKLERVLFTIGGWIRRGYDNQHPDILPAAPECGGDAALAACARRVLDQGYLFCLHDNYQDIYRDSPSWSEHWIGKNSDGSLTTGGAWAGGRAYLTCSQMALELARRPQNLPAVRQLTGANSYFIDTTYAAGLGECFDPQHPLTRADDLKWKVALSDYAREVFGTFGSECGREWAIPHSDFFEGLTGVSGRAYHDAGLQAKLGAAVLPLFELVYRDCIALYGKYGYDPAHAADYVLQHAALGRPLHHHNVPAHLYWKDPTADDVVPASPSVAAFEAVGPREFRIRYRWQITGPVDPGWRVFVHFVDGADRIAFQNDHGLPAAAVAGVPGTFETGPFTVRVPEGASGAYEVGIGLFSAAKGQRARLPIRESDERRHALGTLSVGGAELSFGPADTGLGRGADAAVFQRGTGGWTAGLHPYDRFLKNTHELLSPLHQLTGRFRLTQHEFLDRSRRVQRSVFGEGRDAYEVVVNGSDTAVTRTSKLGGEVELPPHGLLVEGPEFVAFLASRWGGRVYQEPTLFTVRSLDQRALGRARRVRVFHGFGDPTLEFRGRSYRVDREAVVEL